MHLIGLRRYLLALVASFVVIGNASATLVTFDDGTGNNVAIPFSQYPDITMINAVYQNVNGFHDGVYGLGVDVGVRSPNDWAFPGTTAPIIITFDTAATSVSIDALYVGSNGARIEAYSGATLVDADQYIGTSFGVNGLATTLTVTGTYITEIHLLQVFDPVLVADGIGWDNLEYTLVAAAESDVSVPAPAPLLLIGALVAARRWTKRHA